MPRQRLDVYLVEKGLQPTRTRARWAISRGFVLVNGKVAGKPSMPADETDEIIVRESLRYVSQGGYKLEKALNDFRMDLNGKVILDIGSSTGGFTDCALQHGAKMVFAVDVGTGQLHDSLRSDTRVVSYENCDIRNLEPAALFHQKADCITVDVSFISLEHIFPYLSEFLDPSGCVLALIKPQFEAGKELVGKNGIVKDPATHRMVLQKILSVSAKYGFAINGLTWAPVEINKNIEYMALCVPAVEKMTVPIDPATIVQKAFAEKEKLSI